MSWLIVDGNPVASAENIDGTLKKMVGLLGKKDFDGAAVFKRVKSIHTVGMKFGIDVAFVDKEDKVIKVCSLKPNRFVLYVPKAKMAIEAEEGAFFRWSLKPGSKIELK